MDSQSSQDDGPRVGALLRASRLRCGEEATDVARVLHIRLTYIEAIEEGRYDDLPGATYAIGFIRAYAEHLGLDSEEVVRRYKAETSGHDTSTELKFLSPIPENGIPRGAILFVGMVVAVLAYGGWYVSSTRDHFLTDLIPPLPDRLAALLQTDDETDAKAPPSGPDAALASDAPIGSMPAEIVPAEIVPAEIVNADPVAAPRPVVPSAEPGPADTVAETAPPIEVTPVAEVAETTEPSPIEVTPVAEVAEIIAPPPITETPIAETPVVEAAPVAAPEPETAAQPVAQTEPQTEPRTEPQTVAEITETMTLPLAERSAEPAADDPSPAPDAAPPIPLAATTAAPEPPAAPAAPPPPVAEAVADVQRPTPPVAPETEASPNAVGPAEDGGEIAETKPPAAAGGEDGDQVAALAEVAERRPADDAVAPAKNAVAPAEGSESRIVVRARMASWIQVRDDVGNQFLMTRLMRAGDTFRVPDRPGLTLLTGNAGALEILVDGETMPPLGPIGAVRRDVTLDIKRLREGTAAVE